ncbi:MAG: hypothetical protein J0H79_14075 [Alphaproteobacteria bacterium]|nr:hypothetical protein [Alphaproteobacteria bacterium]
MTRRRRQVNVQNEILEALGRGGEAIRDRPHFRIGGFIIGHEMTMLTLVEKGLVSIEEVGESGFARITPAGLAALEGRQ